MNSPEQTPTQALIRRNFAISWNTISNTYMYSRMALRTMTKWQAQLFSINNYQESSPNVKLHLYSRSLCNRSSSQHRRANARNLSFFFRPTLLLSLSNKKNQELLRRLDSMSYFEEILICWIPSYVGLREMKVQTRQPGRSWVQPSKKSRFIILTWNPKSINFFSENGNNAGIITSTSNSFRSSLLR